MTILHFKKLMIKTLFNQVLIPRIAYYKYQVLTLKEEDTRKAIITIINNFVKILNLI